MKKKKKKLLIKINYKTKILHNILYKIHTVYYKDFLSLHIK